jgi:hypothetical protein
MIEFSIVPIKDAARAHSWHFEFVQQNDHMARRSEEDYKTFAKTQQLWGARKLIEDQYVGQIYCTRKANTWEIGGLFVADYYRKVGVGNTLACLALGHLLVVEAPLTDGHAVITRVRIENDKADPLINQLHLRKTRWIEKRIRDENVRVAEEYQLVNPATLLALAVWCESWNGTLKYRTPAQIKLSPRVTLADWAADLRRLATSWSGIRIDHGDK